jgi:predicted dehydrogenase
MAKLRVGIIGTGGIANAHAGGYKGNLDKCELAVVCDVREDAARAFAERHGFAEVVTDYHALLASDKVDCVSVCTPNFLHAPVSIEALQNGKHVLCEKPMATSVADAEKMKAAAEASGKVLYIGFNHRFIGNFHTGKKMIERLGKPIAMRVAVGHGSYDRLQKTWFGQKEKSGGGTLIDNGVHMIDMIRYYFGPIESVQGQVSRVLITEGDVEDNGFALYKLANGAIASLQCSWTWPGGYHLLFEAICENGTLKLDEGKCEVFDNSLPGKILPDVPNMDSWREETGHFLRAAAGEIPPFVTPDDGIAAVKAAVGAYESSETGQAVRIA